MNPAPAYCEVLSSAGPGAIALVELAGPAAASFARRHLRFRSPALAASYPVGRVLRAALLDPAEQVVDEIIVSFHAPLPAPALRLHLHGSPWIVAQVVDWARHSGMGPREAAATPPDGPTADDFEQDVLALLPGVLTQAGVEWLLRQRATLPAALEQIRTAHDPARRAALARELLARPDAATWFTTPLRVALIGPPNAGKSTLANALADRRVSVVSPVPGTTRDWVEAEGEIDGFPVTWIDTAGLRATDDSLELAGIHRTFAIAEGAGVRVAVLDLTPDGAASAREFLSAYAALSLDVLAVSKCDLGVADESLLPPAPRVVRVSGLTGTGIAELTGAVLAAAGRTPAALSEPRPFNARQRQEITELLRPA